MDFLFAHYDKIAAALAIAAAAFFIFKFVAKFTANKIDDAIAEAGDLLVKAITSKLAE